MGVTRRDCLRMSRCRRPWWGAYGVLEECVDHIGWGKLPAKYRQKALRQIPRRNVPGRWRHVTQVAGWREVDHRRSPHSHPIHHCTALTSLEIFYDIHHLHHHFDSIFDTDIDTIFDINIAILMLQYSILILQYLILILPYLTQY